jgi:hypothetical protein
VPETVIRDMRADAAIHLLHMQKNKVLGLGMAPGRRWRAAGPPKLEEVRDSIRRKVEAIIRARALEPGALEARAAEWAKRRETGG